MNFIVRTSIDNQGRLHGVIQRVQGGRKERFEGAAQLGELIAALTVACREPRTGLDRLENGGEAEAGRP